MRNKIKVSIAGATGYTGLECLRYALFHPYVEIEALYGANSAGSRIADVYPALDSYSSMGINEIKEAASDQSDLMFLALPHGTSAEVITYIVKNGYSGKIIDLGSDFRLRKAADYQEWYGYQHTSPSLIGKFVYGLTEFNSENIKSARYVANPGCFATAIQLAIMPLVNARCVRKLFVTGLTGSSGSGNKPSETTHFSTRFGNLKPYKVFEHQHMAEVSQMMNQLTGYIPEIYFTPVSAPIVRGIWLTVSSELSQQVDVPAVFADYYEQKPCIRIRPQLPELKPVIGTCFADIGWVIKNEVITIGIALDNLGKGAAAQAVQNMNLMFDFPETTGLLHPPLIV